MDPVESSELVAFVKTVEARSLSRAAAELRVPRATIGRRLARLEERLGVRMLRQTTRSLALTDAGESFLLHARIALDAIAQAEASVRAGGDPLRGNLRISVPPGMGPSFAELVCRFAEQHPGLKIQVHASTRHVDLLR